MVDIMKPHAVDGDKATGRYFTSAFFVRTRFKMAAATSAATAPEATGCRLAKAQRLPLRDFEE